MDALSLDMRELVDYVPLAEELPEAPEDESDPRRAAWLRRRQGGFGASEVAIVMVALGMRSPDILASYQEPEANPIRIRLHKRAKAVVVPRIFLRKAGLRRPLKIDDTARAGITREPMLVAQWRRMVERGTAGREAEMIDPASILYCARDIPPELLPLRDSVEPRLLCTPDVLARDVFGDLGCVDAKCSHHAYYPKHGGAPECHRIQVHSQMAVCSGAWGGIVEGEGWAATYRDHAGEPTGKVLTWPIERSETLIAECRQACADGWAIVESLRAQREEMAA